MIEQRVALLENAVRDIGVAIRNIDGHLSTLVRLEERHLQNSARVDDHEQRLRAIEEKMPVLGVMRNWIIAGVTAGVGMLLAAFSRVVLK